MPRGFLFLCLALSDAADVAWGPSGAWGQLLGGVLPLRTPQMADNAYTKGGMRFRIQFVDATEAGTQVKPFLLWPAEVHRGSLFFPKNGAFVCLEIHRNLRPAP